MIEDREINFVDEANGLMVVVGFEIEPNTNYELSLKSLSGINDVILPNNRKLLSFVTRDEEPPNPPQNGIDPQMGNAMKDGLHDDGTTNRPVDHVVMVDQRDWLVIQTTEILDDDKTVSFNEAFFPKRTWAEADNFCRNFRDEKDPAAIWALPTQLELLSLMTPEVVDVKKFDETTAQFVVDPKVLPDEGNLDAFHGAIFYDGENEAVYLGNGAIGSAKISYITIDQGQPEEAFFTCVKQ